MPTNGDAIKAIVQDRYGLTVVLRLEDIEYPAVGDGDVLMRVRAAGVDMGVWHLMTGTPYLGNGLVSRTRRALTPHGTLVLGGGEGGGRWIGGTRQLRAMLTAPFVRQRIRSRLALVREEDLLALCELVDAGKVKPVVDRTFPLSEAAQAVDYVVAGKSRGKVVLYP